MYSAGPRETYRFLEFELDVSAYELRRLGVPVKLERQPMDLLILLVEHRQQLVTREAIVDRLWGKDVFIEVETGINTAVRKVRQALGDAPGASACVETVPGKGYRFIAPVTMPSAETDATPVSRASASAADRAPSADPVPAAEDGKRTHSAPTPAASRPARTAGADRSRRTLVALAVAGIAILAVAGAGLFSGLSTSDVPSMQLIQLTAMSGSENWPSFSPDGRQVAFAWDGEKRDNWDIYVKLVGSSDMRRLTTDGGWDFAPSWSPDGRHIAYVRVGPRWGDPLRARVMSSLGGADRQVSDMSVSVLVRWSPDGRSLVAGRVDTTDEGHEGLGIYLIPVEGGDTRAITKPSAPGADMSPAFSPDGHRLAYASCKEPTQQMLCDVRVIEVDAAFSAAGPSRRLTRRTHRIIRGLTWSRDGQFVIYDGEEATLNYLWRVDAAGARPPERIDLAGLSAWFPAADPAGDRIAFIRLLNDADIYRFEAGGPAQPVARSSVFDSNPQFSPDGQRIAFCSARSGRGMDVWVADADGTDPQQLTHGPGGWQCGPTWSPDGQRIAFDSQAQDGSWHIWTVGIRGGTPQQITRDAGDQNMPTWSHDGAWIYFSWMQGTERDIWRTRVATAEKQRLTAGGGGWVGRESSDGSTVLYEPRLKDAPLFAQPLAGGAPRQLARCVTGTAFSSTTAGIYYMPCSEGRERDALAPVRLLNPATGDDREVARLDSYNYSGVPSGFAVSPDGRTILYSRLVSSGSDLMMIDHVK